VAQRSLIEIPPAAVPALKVTLAMDAPELAARVTAALGKAGITAELAKAPAEIGSAADTTASDAVVVFLDPESHSDLTTLRALTTRLPSSHVVVVAPALRPAGVRRAVDAGANAVLSADGDLAEALPPAIRAACAGQVCAPRQLGRHIPRPALSYRERQVLGLVVLGFSNGEIAGRLCLAESTVKSHLSAAFVKLGVRSRSEAAAMVSDADGGLGRGILAISPAALAPSRDGVAG
jgi:DNA-binding NarL/FixJ family response regulator